MATFVQGGSLFHITPGAAAAAPASGSSSVSHAVKSLLTPVSGEDETTSCRLWRTGSLRASTVLNIPAVCSYVQSWKSATLRREAARRVRDRKMVAAPPQSFAFS